MSGRWGVWPFNRIVLIHEFEWTIHVAIEENDHRSPQHIRAAAHMIAATKSHLDEVVIQLQSLVTVMGVTQTFDYADESVADRDAPFDQRLTHFQITSVR